MVSIAMHSPLSPSCHDDCLYGTSLGGDVPTPGHRVMTDRAFRSLTMPHTA